MAGITRHFKLFSPREKTLHIYCWNYYYKKNKNNSMQEVIVRSRPLKDASEYIYTLSEKVG